MKKQDKTVEFDQEYGRFTEEDASQPKTIMVSISSLWELAGKLNNPPKPLKRFNKDQIKDLEDKMRKEGKL